MRKLVSALSILAALALAPLTAWAQGACPIQNQVPVVKTAATYTVAASDICSLLVFQTASTTVTLPNANTLPSGFVVTVKNASSNALTLTPTTSTLDGATTGSINAGGSLEIRGNNANYFSAAGGAGSAFQGSFANNIVQNGDFLIDQQYAGASQSIATSLTRSIDRFFSIYTVSGSGGSAPTTQQVALSTGLTLGSKELKMANNASGATSVTAGMITRTVHQIEGSDVQDLNWNAASGGLSVTVSLWLKSSIASADIGVALVGASTQSYTHDCVLSGTASTWTFCSFTVPAPNTGTWTITPGAVGLNLNIAYQCGSTFQTPANVWTSGTFYCTANQTQVLGTNSATVEIFGVKLERGSTPTLFQATPVAVDLVTLRRFYRSSFPLGTAPAQSAGLAGAVCARSAVTTAATMSVFVPLEPPMYAAPTIVTYNPSASNAKWRDVTGSADITQQVDVSTAKGTYGFEIGTVTDAMTAAHDQCIHYSADAAL